VSTAALCIAPAVLLVAFAAALIRTFRSDDTAEENQ
jgi:hypothetical protein